MDQLTEKQLSLYRKPLLVPGNPYLFILSFGWAIVAHYIGHESGLMLRCANINHFRNAGKDYGKLAMEGAGPGCEWRYEGNGCINLNHVLRVVEYHGTVPTTSVRS